MSSLLRSTKFMRYFAGAARTLILNSAKTAEVNFLLNSKILTVSNNVFMRDYASSSKNESLEPLLQKLDSELRRYGRISKRDIDEVFDEIRRKNDITSSQSLLVIRCCGEMVPEELPEQRTQLVQKIWSVLTERGVPMDISHYNALLRVYIENEHPFSPAEFLNELENKGLQPNRVTYQRLMWRYCQEGDVEGATRVLEKMKELGFPVSEPVLNALVMGHAFHGDTDGARTVLETMASAGLQPTNKTYTLLACGFAKKGDLAGIEDILKIANERDALIGDKDILDIIEHLAIGGHADKVESLYKHLQKGIGYNQDVCNTIFRLINKGQEEVAKSILKTMPSTRAEDNMYKGAFFIKQILKVKNAPENTLKLCKELQEENLVPNAIFIATESALQQGLTELAGLLFKELKKEGIELRDHYYWPLLAKKARENDEEGLLQILRNMASEGLPVTSEALRDYVLPYLVKKDNPQTVITKLQLANVPAILAARNVMVELLSSGKIKEAADVAVLYRPFGQQQLVARPLLNALSKTQDIKSFATILHVITCRLAPADEQSADDAQSSVSVDRNEVGRIVKNAVKLTTDKTDKLLTALIEKGLGISTASAEAIEQYLGEKLTSSISEKLAKLTSPDIELAALRNTRTKSDLPQKNSVQLQGLLEQAKRKGNNVTRIQRQLLSALMLENEVEKVTNLLKELETENFELNSVTLAQIFEFYAQNGEIEKALHYKQYLAQKDPEFALSKYKLVQLALAMVNANRYNEAVQYLKDNKPNDDSTSFLLNTKCWQLLNALAEQKDAEKVKEMTSILTENNYIEHSNVILGPSIKVHLLNDNIEGALAEFEYCCKQYRVTPWKGELMKTLILKEDASKLQWLSDLSTQIHGEVNVLHDLVLAFVECGRLRQARRILETPGMFAKQRRLEDACHRYEQEGKFEYIEGLLEATKELSHIDRSNIFYHLLVTYCKADETDKAVGLWTVLQEEGEVPSDQFLRHLGKHLKSKNRTVPFVIPQDERKQEKPEKKVAPPPQVSKKTITETIENMVKNGKAVQAMDLTIKHIKDGVTPRYPVIKYVLKTLAEVGNVDKVKELGSVATADLKKNLSYDSKLAQAIFANGDGENYIEDLYQKVQKAQSEQDIEDIIIKFPKNESLATIVQTGELLDRCLTIAEQIASKGNNMPINLLWVEFILAGKEKEADDIWNKYLVNSQLVAFRRLLQESYSRNEPQHIEKLIKCLKMNKNVTLSTIANAYSRLVELHMAQANLEDAKKSLEKGFAEGLTIDQINKSTVKRLKTAMEAVGQEFKY